MYLIKNKSGLYSPVDDSDFEQSKGVGVGNVVKATAPRNYQFLKKAMALIKLGFDSQDTYESQEIYRKLLTVRAGFYDEVKDEYGSIHKFPHSLAFDKMNAETFSRWYNATLEVIAKDTDTASEDLKREVDQFY